MSNQKAILVTTTSSIEGKLVKEYLKPISAHLVAGTNITSDFLASFTDVFGGRSGTYQRQLRSLYREAVERLKISAYEIGANCILGLKIDIDEISGKGKSMFMITAIGTAVIIETPARKEITSISAEKHESVDIDRINALKTKRGIILNAQKGALTLTDEVWNFITANHVPEVYPFVMGRLREVVTTTAVDPNAFHAFFKKVQGYIETIEDDIRIKLIYDTLTTETDARMLERIFEIIRDLQLLHLEWINAALTDGDFLKQKKALQVVTFDKAYYNQDDVDQLSVICQKIKAGFGERGTRSMKKGLLSKEKEVWTCECGKVNDIGTVCSGCFNDINGFKSDETKAADAVNAIDEKISLINEYLK